MPQNSSQKILFIARTSPTSAKGGDMFVLKNILKALSEIEIFTDLLCFSDKKTDFAEENIYLVPKEPKFSFKKIFEWFFQQKSYLFNRFYSKKLSQKLLELVKTGEYSTLVFEHAYMYTNLLYNAKLKKEIESRKIKTILNMHVLESCVFEQAYGTNLLLKREINFQKNAEKECINHAEKTVFLSKEELERVEKTLSDCKNKLYFLPAAPIINNCEYSNPELEEKNSIYFLGTYSWIQNWDAIKYFVKEIFPLILEKNPYVKLYLLGMNAPKNIKSLHDDKNIFFIGEVDNVFEYIKNYSVMIVPLRIKGGTRIKIAEALCHGKAIISTSAGMEGIETNDENPVIIAEKSEYFAAKVLELLENDDLKNKTKQSARTFAEKYYDSQKFKEEIRRIFL
jgi:glycosyltransferase involved in cell wall biosynthesis